MLQVTPARIHAFKRDGTFLIATRVASGYLSELHLIGDSILFSVYDHATGLVLGKVGLRDVVGPASAVERPPVVPTFGNGPPEYAAYPKMNGLNQATVVPTADGYWLGFAGVDYLMQLDRSGSQIGRLDVPAVVRPAATPEILEASFGKDAHLSNPEEISAVSFLNQAWMDSHGRLVLWYQQNREEGDPANSVFLGRAWITVVDPATGRGCFDMELPFPGTDWPRVTFAADTVYALDQIEREPGRVESVVRKYPIGELTCEERPSDDV